MMVALEAMDAAGHSPRLALLERCVARWDAGCARVRAPGCQPGRGRLWAVGGTGSKRAPLL